MVKFFNNLENEEKFMAIVNNLKKVEDINYEGYDTSDPLDEMNNFMDVVDGLLCNDRNVDINIYCWFSRIYKSWMYGCCDDLSVETINKSFEAAQNGKHFYDAAGFLDNYGWDKNLVEYVLAKKEDFIILSDKDDYKMFYNKYDVTVECLDGYYTSNISLWQPYKYVESDVADCMENCAVNDLCENGFEENKYGDWEDEDGNVIRLEDEATAYAKSWLSELDYEYVNITVDEYYN